MTTDTPVGKNRSTVKVKARVLEDVDVNYISLVENGANRIPFRVLKSETQEMINLSDLFFKAKKSDKVPAIVAAVITDGANVAGYQKSLADAGYDLPAIVSDTDSGVSVLKAEEDAVFTDDKHVVIKTSDEVAFIVVNLNKTMMSYPDSSDFGENVKKAGFFPGVRVATDVLMETVYNIASEEGDQEATLEKLEKSLADYQTYVLTLAKSVPASVFKMETLAPAEIEKQDTQSDAAQSGTQDGEPQAADVQKTDDQKTDPSTDDGQAASSDVQKAADLNQGLEFTDEPGGADVQKSDSGESPEGGTADVAKTELTLDTITAAITKQLAPVVESLSGMQKNVDALTEQVAEVKKTADNARTAVEGTVVADAPSDNVRLAASGTVQKSEDDPAFWDTALRFDGFERA